jgi:hypothetical protein
MRLLVSIALSTALVALTGCSIGQNPIIGKWKCLRPDITDKEVINYSEFLADGTLLRKVEYPKGEGLTQESTGTWKAVEENRITMTEAGASNTVAYKITGDKFQWTPPDGVTCDRVK